MGIRKKTPTYETRTRSVAEGIIASLVGVFSFFLVFCPGIVLATDDGILSHEPVDTIIDSSNVTNPTNATGASDSNFAVVTGSASWYIKANLSSAKFDSGAYLGDYGGWRIYGNTNGFTNQKVKYNYYNSLNGVKCYVSDVEVNLAGGSAVASGLTDQMYSNAGYVWFDNCQATFIGSTHPRPWDVYIKVYKSTSANIEIDYLTMSIGYTFTDSYATSVESGQQTSDVLQKSLDFEGYTPIATSQMHCEVLVGQICTDNGVEVTHNNSVARIVMNASDNFTETQNYGDNFTYNAYGWSLGGRHWQASVPVPLFINAVCTYPQSLICTTPDGNGGYTVATASSQMQSFVDNPSYYNDVDWTYTEADIATYSASITLKPTNNTDCDMWCWLAEKLTAAWTRIFIPPATLSLTGWEGFRYRMTQKFPFSIANTIYQTSLSSIASSSAIPISSITFNIYGNNTEEEIEFTDPNNVVADTVSNIKTTLRYVIWGFCFVYLIMFARRITQ